MLLYLCLPVCPSCLSLSAPLCVCFSLSLFHFVFVSVFLSVYACLTVSVCLSVSETHHVDAKVCHKLPACFVVLTSVKIFPHAETHT